VTVEPLPRALCLSGGGYRAMLFHLGALWRLNEAKLLPTFDLISSVSGGSITAGVLATRWPELDFDETGYARRLDLVADDLHRFAGRTVDVWVVLRGLLGPGSIADRVAAVYARDLFGTRTLQDLPDEPRFVFCASNVQTGALWRFSKRYMADYQVGMVPDPTVPLAVAVAASSAFPPFLSPLTLKLDPASFQTRGRGPLFVAPYDERAILSDGGVYDNLGLEPAWKRSTTIMVSDGGGHLAPDPRPSRLWPLHLLRVLKLMDSQVRALRKRDLIAAYRAAADPHHGTYWGVRTDIADYGLAETLPCPLDRTTVLAETPTRLAKLDVRRQRRLVNWGYAVSDAALRRYVFPVPGAPGTFPYPQEGV